MSAHLIAIVLFASPWLVETPAYDAAWIDPPARFALPAFAPGVRVTDIANGQAIPAKVQINHGRAYAYWTRPDDGRAPRVFVLEPLPAPPAEAPVFVGAGDRLSYGPVRTVDLGVGMWAAAMPIDWDRDGDWDLLYSCTDRPNHGVYLFLQAADGVFDLAERLGPGLHRPQLADIDGDGTLDLLAGSGEVAGEALPVHYYPDVRRNAMAERRPLVLALPEGRANGLFLRQADWDGDGRPDFLAAANDPAEYPRSCAFDENGRWTKGTWHGYVWFYRNAGDGRFDAPIRLEAGDRPIDRVGMAHPCAEDWDADGALELVCGEFLDGFAYYDAAAHGAYPILAEGVPLRTAEAVLRLERCMMNPLPVDWNRDGLPDLIVGEEEGHIRVLINEGIQGGAPHFRPEPYLKMRSHDLKAGGLPRPWLDQTAGVLYTGAPAGYIERFDWTGAAFESGVNLAHDGAPLRIQAGYNGSVQGPIEAKWGYTSPALGDIDGDGRDDLVINSVTGRIEWTQLDGPRIGPLRPIDVAWPAQPPKPAWEWRTPGPEELLVQWRTRPILLDHDGDGLDDLHLCDHEGYLAVYKNLGGRFAPGERPYRDESGAPFRLTAEECGRSGRVHFDLADWDGDGDRDLVRDGASVQWFENVGEGRLVSRGALVGPELEGHTPAPQAVDWNRDGRPGLLVGAEDGGVYLYHRAAIERPAAVDARLLPATEVLSPPAARTR